MSKILTDLKSAVLRDVEILEDTANTQALTDAGNYLNERAADVYSRRSWGEYGILGTFLIPALTRVIQLTDPTVDSQFSSGNGYLNQFAEFTTVSNGTTPLTPIDASAINQIDPTLWNYTGEPFKYVNLGPKGIRLCGYYSTATTLTVWGKAKFQVLADSEFWILDTEGKAILKGATADMFKYHEKDDNRANALYAEFEAEIAKLIDRAENQRGNSKQFIPLTPHTDLYGQYQIDTSRTGALSGYRFSS